MSEYRFFASVYDRMMADIPYDQWKHNLLQLLYIYGIRPCSRITELGCGTGIMTQMLSDDGFVMTGIDISEDMLKEARDRAPGDNADVSDNVQPEYLKADMRSFKVSEAQAAVISICDSMNYLLKDDDMSETMNAVKGSLIPGGVFIFDLKTEYLYERLDGKRYSEDMGDLTYVWNNSYDRDEHIHTYDLEFSVKEGDGCRTEKEVHLQRAYSITEIKSAAEAAGYIFCDVYDAEDLGQPKDDSKRIYAVLGTE